MKRNTPTSPRIKVRKSLRGDIACGCRTRAFHLRAVCPEGAGRSPSAQRWKGFKGDGFHKHRARQVQTLVLPRLSRQRPRPAPRARLPLASAAVLRDSELKRPPAAARSRSFCRGQSRGEPFVASGAFRDRCSTIAFALSQSRLREARGTEGRASAERRLGSKRCLCLPAGSAYMLRVVVESSSSQRYRGSRQRPG